MDLTAYVGLSPVTGLFCHRHSQSEVLSLPGWAKQNSANLTLASGRQDHTILPSAAIVSRQRAVDRSQIQRTRPAIPSHAKRCRVHRIPCPTSVTIAKRPSVWDGMGLLYYCFYQTGKRNIFDAGTGHDIGRTACKSE